jgi:histidinol-phosphate/aromatic aminotransferase/cobyric acid decarboxylase-like protein
LADSGHLERTLARLAAAKTALWTSLREQGWQPLPSAAHFFLLPVGDAAACRSALLGRGVVVRDCASFGLPGHIRIAARRPEENDQLLTALASLQAKRF